MGTISKVPIFYQPLIGSHKKFRGISVFGAFLEGKIYEEPLNTKRLIVFGNEGGGIRSELEPYIRSSLIYSHFSSLCTEQQNH